MCGWKYGRPVAVLLVCGAVLSACGGGEGPSRPGSRIGEAGPEPGERTTPLPEDGGRAASVWAASVLGRADALFATSAREESGFGESDVHDTECSGLSCSGWGSDRIGVDDAGPLAGAGVDEHVGVIIRGIDVVSGLDAESWGGWMRHAGFGVLLEREGTGAGLREFRYGLAVGELSELTEVTEGQDMKPVWRGRMVGVTETGGFAAGRLTGVATLRHDIFGAVHDDSEDGDVVGRIDAEFTEIVNVSTGASFGDARFEDVPVSLRDVTRTPVEAEGPLPEGEEPEVDVTARLAFDAGVAGNRIRGGFFGPGRAEVAGVFEQNGILGAFGAEN